ncbi:MAG TPA: serine hydrolase domain-containing protein [Gaiellaceae bacterium]|nr:serine hydrolase domain-containing protein [Gaiellaceae bacterium]
MPDTTALDRLLQEKQADRLPSVAASVVRKGDIVWSNAVGYANYDGDVEATPTTQYRIGSITKTFTATAIMQLRDAGELELDDRLDKHLPDIDSGPTLRRMLSHLSGMQREVGEMWVDGTTPTEEDLIAGYVLDAHQAHHYSNLAFGLLGRVVAARSGIPYTQYVDERILAPLGMQRTTWFSQEPKAQGYLVNDYARTVWKEPESDLGGVAAMGQLWSTVEDLATWATFLARGAEGVLDEKTIESMWFPQVMYFPDRWVLGWGLGLMLYNHEGTIYGGHGGAMAGHLAGVYVDRKTQVGAAALTNSGSRADMDMLAIELAAKARELWPEEIEVWRPEEEPPANIAAILGTWWSEGTEFLFWWEKGKLHARVASLPPGRGETTFEPQGDHFRAVEGRERGEHLYIRGEEMVWAGYSFTRTQQPFKA